MIGSDIRRLQELINSLKALEAENDQTNNENITTPENITNNSSDVTSNITQNNVTE